MVVFPMTIGVVLAPFRAVSPMKPDVVPDTGRRAPPQSLQSSSSSINTRSHISNLERVLLRTVPRAPSHFPPSSSAVRPSGGLLQNLSSLFSSDEVSPRGLARLQRLLSDSARPSPKSSIASQWRILHGAHDWAGLLNPLDENLRRELIRYGELVQSAYQAFLSIPSAPFTLPDRSYRFTCTLSASSSLQIPPWIRTSAPSRIGFVAVCDDDREIARMGRRDIVISLRGTATALEWAENLRTTLRPLPGSQMSKVSSGFLSLYKSTGDSNRSLSTAVIDEIRRLIRQYAGEDLSITIAGHSLGAALAILIADELTEEIENAPPVAVVSFGGPRVGNRAFAERVERKGVKVLRVVNANDFVTRVPGVLPDLGHEGYVHVGAELRVDNRDSPYLKPNADPACCHDLEAYLHLVDGFLGTGCPFRSNAKRNLARLLSQQRPNVKKIYVSRMRSLQAARSDRTVGVHQGCLVSPSR